MTNSRKGLLFVISGPSGVGKGTICRGLLSCYADVEYSVSATTRKPRTGETHGKEYFFYSKEEFQELIRREEFLEWAKVYDNYYGTPRRYVESIISQGKDCLLEIDVQGALQVKHKMPEGIFIFIMPPSKEELVRRITCRGTEQPEEISKRMKKVDEELTHLEDYDYVVLNDHLSRAVETVRAIMTAERCRVNKSCYKLEV